MLGVQGERAAAGGVPCVAVGRYVRFGMERGGGGIVSRRCVHYMWMAWLDSLNVQTTEADFDS